MSEEAMSEDEAKAMLRRLSRHYRCPVMPIDYYCAALRQWQSVVKEAGKGFSEAVDTAFRAISKSCLLDRLLYAGQKLRTRKCPEHKGEWSGLEHPDNYCPHGCGFTGWLPEPEDASPWPPGVFMCTSAAGTVLEKDRKPYTPAPGEPTLKEWRAKRNAAR